MTGFSTDWLALREPADRRARNGAVLASLAAFASGRKSLTILDLGAGTGSTLRTVSPALPAAQRWRLVDDDAALAVAGERLLALWSTAQTNGTAVTFGYERADLATADLPALFAGADLVTASALFDLVSADFAERFADAVAVAGAAVYLALDVDGTVVWSPGHPDDAAVAAAFLRHQAIDKGFGPALGPAATATVAAALAARGYRVETGKSPWRLDAADADLIAALAEGRADAARRAGLDAAVAGRWLAARRGASGCVIGHTDLFAVPPQG